MAQELKLYEMDTDYPNSIQDGCYYDSDEVDAVIAAKDAENRRLNNALDKERSETIKYMDEFCNAKNEIERLTIDKRNDELRADVAEATVEKLKAEIARLKACMENMVNTSNMVNDSVMRRERRLKRALWSMGAMLGKMGSLAYWNIKAKLSAMGDTEGVDWASRKHVQWKNVERKCRQRADGFK